ncbi:MAG: shikimate kinase [Bdellovibrionales bacterium]
MMTNTNAPSTASFVAKRMIVLTGIMGSGKSTIGRRLATRLNLPFTDSDQAIEEAAGMTIPQIFERFGEAEFRNGERRVITRLLEGPVGVLATGGGAFVDPSTRALIKDKAVSIWLRADLDVLFERTSRRDGRPLLQVENPRERLASLLEKREPYYAEADITVESGVGPVEETVTRALAALISQQQVPDA